jgi:hypothetical protein
VVWSVTWPILLAVGMMLPALYIESIAIKAAIVLASSAVFALIVWIFAMRTEEREFIKSKLSISKN